ncbi:DUF1553 domain-containing protein [Chryseolinea lacunae]|uniref:DUF1553 domain-containing protein n=1 Tax=Chryseolinea lacunae TaxID=2801331 RepID=A0ABS1KW33_9BACT|nr:DUF1553 domain-containing protein [Chryseolinea lacunae]MBL0743528.1 DUF1553 domain-containing protein [Chryseolinea lacunae]
MIRSNKIVFFIPLLVAFAACREKKIDFSAQVKPILNKHCISCHGGVKRNANYSLLFRTEALDTAESGKHPIVPGHPEQSEFIRRITSTDPEVRMPYKEHPLSAEDIEILKQWIKEGAEWGEHWAYIAPKPVAIPEVTTLQAGFGESDTPWAKNEVDHFVLAKLEEQKLSPSAEADKATLVRRIYLDLIGLPPTPEQASRFVNDAGADAYEKTVDELLASPRFGEKWASWWLDMARYSDTKGYERDVGRSIWRYRDWVINAFNKDMPFDQFTVEQLAGDLLPNPTDDQLIATAFHRNTMNNDEGGTEDEEFRVAALIDRVSTTWQVWQSTTMACVQCHTHPYDPFLHDEYYKSLAFFNNTRDEDTEGEHPNLRIYKPEDEQKLTAIKEWVKTHAGSTQEAEVTRFLKTLEPKFHPHDFDQFVNGELIDTKWLGVRPGGSARLKQIDMAGKRNLIVNYWSDSEGGSFEIRQDKLNGDVVGTLQVKKTSGRQIVSIPLKAASGKHDLYFVFHNSKIKPDKAVCGIEWFAFRDDLPGKGDAHYDGIRSNFMTLLNTSVDNTPIMIENNAEQHRATHIYERGNWVVKGAEVKPGVPASLNPFPKDQPYNRLGFAHWLLEKQNPLTARTMVNRFWEQIFGAGIVETLEDFGTQSASPTHQELLDYLSLQFMNEDRWSMKKLIKTMVMSATYRQDSRLTQEMLEKDPGNRWLARGPRVRLSSEQVRDQALACGGMLSNKMFGKSVMPYQPNGIWSSVWNGDYWKASEGEDQYRRSLYTYIKRTSPYPSMMMFDGSSREVCVIRRIRTNTPLQALVTLNDSSYVVAARGLALRMMKDNATPKDQINAGYRMILVRDMPAQKLAVMQGLYDDALKQYTTNKEASRKLAATQNDSPQLAALTLVASAMLNLDEVLTKE